MICSIWSVLNNKNNIFLKYIFNSNQNSYADFWKNLSFSNPNGFPISVWWIYYYIFCNTYKFYGCQEVRVISTWKHVAIYFSNYKWKLSVLPNIRIPKVSWIWKLFPNENRCHCCLTSSCTRQGSHLDPPIQYP